MMVAGPVFGRGMDCRVAGSQMYFGDKSPGFSELQEKVTEVRKKLQG